jgi:hypothetical protein
MQPWRSGCIRSRLLGGTLGDDSTEHGTRYPVSRENCRKRIRLRRQLFRCSSTSELPSFAALVVHAMNRLGRSRSLLRTVDEVELAIPSSLSHGWGQVRRSHSLAPSSSTARSEECTRDRPPLRMRVCSHTSLAPVLQFGHRLRSFLLLSRRRTRVAKLRRAALPPPA